jgi:single-strand DNA-binding protein
MQIRNQIQVIGNVGQEPEQRGKTRDGKPVVVFSVAQNVMGTDPKTGDRVPREPQWFQVSCFAGMAERALSALKKGNLVLVAGELKARNYTNRGGEKRVGFEILASDVLRVERLRSQSDERLRSRSDTAAPATDPTSPSDSMPSFDDWSEDQIAVGG